MGELEAATLGELIAAPGPRSERSCTSASRAQTVRRVLDEMPEPEREVIRLRYGIDGDAEPQTYASIGQRLGLTPVRVSAIEKRALAELALRRELKALSDAA